MEFLNLEQIREFPKPLDADEELKNNYINLEKAPSPLCIIAVKRLINQNRENILL